MLLPALQVDQVCTGRLGRGICAGLWCLTDNQAFSGARGTHNKICRALSSPIGTQQQTSGTSWQGQTEVRNDRLALQRKAKSQGTDH